MISLKKQQQNNSNNKATFNVFLYSDIYRLTSFKLGIVIGTTILYVLISVWMTFTFIQGDSCMRNQKLKCPFSQKFQSIWMEFIFLATTCWFVEAHAKFIFVQIIFKGDNCADLIL